MKRKSRKLKTRIPMPPPQKPHSTKKGKRGYARRRDKRPTLKEEKEEEDKMDEDMEGVMGDYRRELDQKERYGNAVRNLTPAQVALVEKRELSPDEEKEIRASGQMAYARRVFLELPPDRTGNLPPFH